MKNADMPDKIHERRKVKRFRDAGSINNNTLLLIQLTSGSGLLALNFKLHQ
jgi:hypothetical protein